MRRLLVLAAAAARSAPRPPPGGRTNECRGLQICVPVAGPWVVASPGRVEFQLSCPRRFVVARARRGADRARHRRRLRRQPRQPGEPRHHDVARRGLPRPPRRAAAMRRRASARTSAACRRPGAAGATPTAYHAFPPGKPASRRRGDACRPARHDRARGRSLRGRRAPRHGDARGRLLRRRAAAGSRRARRHGEQDVRGGARAPDGARRHAAVAGGRAVVQLDLVCAPR